MYGLERHQYNGNSNVKCQASGCMLIYQKLLQLSNNQDMNSMCDAPPTKNAIQMSTLDIAFEPRIQNLLLHHE